MNRNANELKRSHSRSSQAQSPAKRQFRNENEKRRRDLFTQLVANLKEILASGHAASTNDDQHKLDKASILSQAAKYLHENHQKLTDEAKIRLANVRNSPSSPLPSNSLIDMRWKAPCDIVSDEEWLEIAIQSMNCFFLVVKNDFNTNEIVHVSRNVRAYLGYTPEQLITHSIYEFLPTSDHQRLRTYLANQHQVLQNCDVSWKQAQNDSYEQCTIVGAYRNVNDNETYLMSIVKVNTLDRSAVVDVECATSEFVTHLNVQGKFVFIDPKARELLGYTSFELIGRTYFDFIHPDDLTIMSRAYQLWKQNGNGVSDQYRFLTKGEQWISLQTSAQAHVNPWTGNIESYICTTQIVQSTNATSQQQGSLRSTSTLPKTPKSNSLPYPDSTPPPPATTMSSASTANLTEKISPSSSLGSSSSSSSDNEITSFLSKLRDGVYRKEVSEKLTERRKAREDEIRTRREEIQTIDELLHLVNQYQSRSTSHSHGDSNPPNTTSDHLFPSNCDFLLMKSPQHDGIDHDSTPTAPRQDGVGDPLESLFSSSSSTTMDFNPALASFPNLSSQSDLLEDMNYLTGNRDLPPDPIFPRSPFSQ